MTKPIDFNILNQILSEDFTEQVQNIYEILISDLSEYLGLEPFYKTVKIEILSETKSKIETNANILDRGVNRLYKDISLVIQINEKNEDFYPFILLREVYYLFLPNLIKDNKMIKVFINQILENNLEKSKGFEKWHKLIRDILVNRDFLFTQSDKLQKFFKIEASRGQESTIQFFFRDINENALVIRNRNISNYYDELFEKYTYKTSKSLYNEDIIKTLLILHRIFNENRRYVNLTDYQNFYNKLLTEKKIEPTLSLKRFYENLQWINKCTSIAPSYQYNFSAIGISPLLCDLTFNPLLEKNKIKNLMEHFPFWQSPKIIENSFASKVIVNILIPTIYTKDFLGYLNKLQAQGYLINKHVYQFQAVRNFLNLNYFKGISNNTKIIDPLLQKYKRDYECEHAIKFHTTKSPYPLSIFDYTLLSRTKYFSVTGLTFDKRIETLNAIKKDVENENRKQISYIDGFRDNFQKLQQSTHIKEALTTFLDHNLQLGLFFLREMLNSVLKLSTLIQKILRENPKITSTQQFIHYLHDNSLSQILEENLLKQKTQVKKFVFNIILPKYFQSIEFYEEEIQKYRLFHDIIVACFNLKIFSIKEIITIIKNPVLISKIIKEKEESHKKAFKQLKSYKITNQKIEAVIDEFLAQDPPIIVPMLINTILTSQFAKFYPEIFLRNTPETYKKLERLKSHFPRVFLTEALDLESQESIFHIQTYSLNFQEKAKFTSSLYNLFKDNLLIVRRTFWRGIVRAAKIDPKDFYDFENEQFIYSKDYFKQFYIYTKNNFNNKKLVRYNKENAKSPLNLFWSPNSSLKELVNIVKKRSSSQMIGINPSQINKLVDFRSKLEQTLLDQENFHDTKSSEFFNTFVKSIKFIPAFRKYGLAQYYLYLCPHDWNNIDLKLLFINSFQNIKYPAQIDQNQPVLIKTLFPYRTPNKTYLNWLVKSKKAIRESCLFFIKRIFEINQFDHNLSTTGWHYSSNRFKIHIQNVLFNPNYSPQTLNVREFNIDKYPDNEAHGLDTPEFTALNQLYNRRPLDLKSFLGTNKYNFINIITTLLEKQLIFPYINYKNLGFQDKITIILPNVKNGIEDKMIKLFNFFNVCRIYEIEGDFYIYGFEEIQSFETGYMIEIWFPKCEMDEFLDVFDLLFEYLEIKQYLILTDLFQGKTLIKNAFGSLKFLEQYNPLINLRWNGKDKIWLNHKIFNEKFEPIYPDLFYGSNIESTKFIERDFKD